MIDKELVAIKRKFLEVYRIPEHVGVDETFPLGSIECYTLQRVKNGCSPMTVNILFYVTLQEIIKLNDKDGHGTICGRTQWGPYCKLTCDFYRVQYVCRLSDDEAEDYRKSIYEEVF